MNALALPFALPEDELPARETGTVTQRSRFADEAREAALDRAVAEARSPEQLAAAWDAVDAYEAERSAEAEEQVNQLSAEQERR